MKITHKSRIANKFDFRTNLQSLFALCKQPYQYAVLPPDDYWWPQNEISLPLYSFL